MSTQQQPDPQPDQPIAGTYARGTRVSVKGTGPGTVIGGVVKSDGSLMWSVLVDGAQRAARYPAADVVELSVPTTGADSPAASAPAATIARVSNASDRTLVLVILAAFVLVCTAGDGWGGFLGALVLALPVAAITRLVVIAFRPLARFAFGAVRHDG